MPWLALLLSMGAASHWPHARSLRPNVTKATWPNPVPTVLSLISPMSNDTRYTRTSLFQRPDIECTVNIV